MKGKLVLAVGALALVGAGGAALAYATVSDTPATINACVGPDGSLRVPASGRTCTRRETPLAWNVQGPAGPAGPAGPQGIAGRDGRDGQPGSQTLTIAGAVDGTMTVTGQKQGPITGGGPNGAIVIEGMTHNIVSPRDPASGLPTGKRQHKPIVITKEIDRSSPLLMEALFTNENLPAVQLTLDNPSGQPVATIKLTNANVAERSEAGATETISFTYQKIEWTWIDGGITAEDDWEAPVA